MATDASLSSGEFDEAEFLRYALHSSSVESEKMRLVRCIESVQGQISTLVSGCHTELLSHLESLHASEKSVQGIRALGDTLQSSATRLRHTIQEPHEQICVKVNQLRNCMTCADLLRQVHRFLGLLSKLREVHETDVMRAARTLRDIEEVLAQQDLAGIDVVDQQMDFVTSCSAAIRSRALDMLKRSLASQNHVDCGAAMQSFYSLDSLPRVIHSIVAEHKREALRAIVRGLDISTIQQSIGMDSTKSSEGARTREVVFDALESTLSMLVTHCNALTVMWRVFHRRKDPLTQQTFAQAAPFDGNNPLDEFWSTISSQLKEKIQKITRRNNFHAMMVAEFPRVSKLLKSFAESIVDFLRETKRTTSTPESKLSQFPSASLSGPWLKEILPELQQHFSAMSIDRQREKYQACLAKLSSTVPPAAIENTQLEIVADVDRHGALPQQVVVIDPRPFLKHVSQEIAVSRQDPAILAIVLTNAHNSLMQLFHKMSDAVARHAPTSVSVVASSMTGGQIYVTAVANAAGSASVDISGWIALLPGLDDPDSLKACRQLKGLAEQFKHLASSVIMPFFDAGSKSLSRQLARLSEVTDYDDARRSFEAALQHFVSRFALLFDRSTGSDACCQELAALLLRVCAVSAFVARPPTEAAKEKVIKFLADFEDSVSLLCPIDRVGPQQRILRAVKRLSSIRDLSEFHRTLEEWRPRLHCVLLLLFVFRHVDASQLRPIHVVMKVKAVDFVEQMASLIADDAAPCTAAVWEAAAQSLSEYEKKQLQAEDERAKRKAVVELCAALKSGGSSTN